jgi:hypothetical protein
VSSIADVLDFKVYGEMSRTPDKDYQTPNDVEYVHIFDATTVSRPSAESNEWSYDVPRYWHNNLTYHFFAVWPSTLNTSIYDDGYQIQYEAPLTADDDVLVAYYSTYIEEDATTYPAVTLNFGRILSKVRFEIEQDWVKNPSDNFWIESVKIENVKRGGTLTTSRFNKVGSWYYGEDKLNFEKVYDGEHGDLLEHHEIITPWGGEGVGLHFVAQPIALNEISLTIKYSYQQNGRIENTAPIETTTVTKSLPVGEWAPGKTYTYNVKLYKDNLIVFTSIAVEEWGEPITGGTIIIK